MRNIIIIHTKTKALLAVFYSVSFVMMLFSNPQLSFAHHVRNANFLSVAIYRLSEHITWQKTKEIQQYRIHVIDDNPDVAKELKRIAALRQLHHRPIQISQSNDTVIPKNTQIIFIAKHNSHSLAQVLKQVKSSNTLIISFGINDQRDIMINFKTDPKVPQKIKFEINKANIINQGMKIDPNIILLGGTEIDVAHLYRDTQTQLGENERKLEIVENEIKKTIKEKNIMELLLTDLTQTINQQKKIVKQQKQIVEQQKIKYTKLEQATKSQEEKIRTQVVELQKREKYLTKQSIEIDKRSAILNQQQNKIDSLASAISTQNKIINKQKLTLTKSNETIESQRSYLFILSILIALALLSTYIAYLYFRKNQRINTELVKALRETKNHADRIQVVNEQLQSFSYTVSHDLRAPLRSIAGFSQIIEEDYTEVLDEEGKKYLNRISDNVTKMDTLITEILMLSKLSQAEVNYKENVNLSEIVKNELNQLNEIEKREKLELDIKENVKCNCDPGLIQIIIANLVGNAWKYTPSSKAAKFVFGTKKIKDEFVYFIKDNGVGFDMRYANKLFEPFQRLHDKEFDGTGIGLATVKRIINLHHGKIWAESEIDKGTTFYFTLSSTH